MGYGPTPIIPFSDWSVIYISLGKYCVINVGIPIPKLTYIPFLISLTALFAIMSLVDN